MVMRKIVVNMSNKSRNDYYKVLDLLKLYGCEYQEYVDINNKEEDVKSLQNEVYKWKTKYENLEELYYEVTEMIQ